MTEASPIISRLTAWRRAPAIVGLVALALLHVAAAVHQFEHSADHEFSVCEACGAYSQLEDTAVSCTPSDDLLVASHDIIAATRADAFKPPFAATYRSRAPPLS